MAQNKEGTEKKPGVKIQDLSPTKDAKGGAARPNAANPNAVNADGVGANKFDPNAIRPNAGGGKFEE